MWNEITEIGGFLLRWKFLTLLTLWLAEHVVAWAAWPGVHAVSNIQFFRSTFVKFQDLKRQHEQLLEGFRRVELMMRKKPSQTRSVASSTDEASVSNPFHSSAVVALAPGSGTSTLCALLCIACRTRKSLEEVYRDYAARLPYDFHFTAKQIISFLGFPDEDDDFVDLDRVFADPPRHLAQDVSMWIEGFNRGISDDVLYRSLLVRYYDSLEKKPRVVLTNIVAGVTLPLLCCKLPLDELRIRWRKRTSQDDVGTQRLKLNLWERVWNDFPGTQIENEALIRFLSVQFCRFKDLLAGYIEAESGLDPDLNKRTFEFLCDLLLSPRYT